MKYSILLFLVLSVRCLLAQQSRDITPVSIEKNILKKAMASFAMCVGSFEKEDKQISYTSGCGFIINGQYIATCRHLLFRSTNKLKSMKVYYANDSTEVDLNYKYKGKQYDFSIHQFDKSKSTTDFIILKLKKNTTLNADLKTPTDSLRPHDVLFSLGLSNGKLKFSKGEFLFNNKEINDSGVYFINFLMDADHGFSGSLIIDINGNIRGMAQSGWSTFENLNKDCPDLKRKKIYQYIENGYKNGQKVGEALKIDYIVNTYLKGFIE